MRTIVWLSSVLTISSLVFACADAPERSRAIGSGGRSENNAGAGGRATGAAGVSSMAGTADQPSLRLGDALTFVAGTGEVPYAIGENAYGIRGSGFLARSALGNTITVGSEPSKLCIFGRLEEVPNGDYSHYWGVEIGFNLNQTTPAGTSPVGWAGSGGVEGGAGGAAGGGGDAGVMSAAGSTAMAEVAQPWLPGEVIGFSFVIEGPTINLIRFKALPAGYDATLESSVYCKSVTPLSGEPTPVLFSELKQYCWNATANLVIPTSAGFANLSWQLPADVAVGARPFDWCLTELRPILAE